MAEPKITKADILAGCKGMLCKNLYVIHSKPTAGLEAVTKHTGPHLAYQVELERKGIMFGAGPLFADNESDWLGEGMVIIRAGSLDEARRIAAADPMHAAGARSFTVRPWLLNEGTITVRINYSNGSHEVL